MANNVKARDITKPLILALLFTVLNHYAVYLPWIVGDQEKIVQATEYKKNLRERVRQTNNLSRDNLAKKFLLIDVSNDMAVYCDSSKADSLGLPVDPGSSKTSPCYAGTDLKKLTQLFKWLANHQDQYNLVVCDILFGNLQGVKQSDSLLGYILNIAQNRYHQKILFPALYNQNSGLFVTSTFSANLPVESKGAINEKLTGDRFLKYRLSYDNGQTKTLPLLMLQTIDSFKVEPGFLGFSIYTQKNGAPTIASNYFIPEMLFSKEDIDSLKIPGNFYGASVDSTVGRMELWQTLLKLGDTSNYYLQEVLRTRSPNKRNIFIGSFNHNNPDVHKTIYGDMDGGLVLLNIYYNLVLNENGFDLRYTLFVFEFFFLISWLILHPLHNPYRIRPLIPRVLLDIFFEELHGILFIAITWFSSIFFDKTSNVLVLLGGIIIIDKFIKTYKKDKHPHSDGERSMTSDPETTPGLGLLLILTIMAITGIYLIPPMAQSLSFHSFADHRTLIGVPNFANVTSNLPFLFVGIWGFVTLRRFSTPRPIFLMYTLLFTGVILTGLGSAYYHSNPNNDSLVWDRIPMTIVFMAFLSATVAELIGRRLGARLLIPLVIVGIGSVLWWHYTEGLGHGDLRLYYLVQFYPMLAIPLILWLYYDPTHKPALLCLVWVVLWYIVAKLLEHWDYPIYSLFGISGHTLKHIAAAASTWYFVVLFQRKYSGNTLRSPSPGERSK